MDGIEIKLLMSFMTNSGRKVSLFVTDPREDVTETEIKEVMDLIIEKNIFAPNGEDIVSAKDAKIVQTETWNTRNALLSFWGAFLAILKIIWRNISLELDLMQLVANLGFPAIVTMYLLVRIEGKLESLRIGINSLNSNISELNNKI